MEVVILADAEAVATLVADSIKRLVSSKSDAVLGLATGSSPMGVYGELVRRHRAGTLSFRSTTAFLLDEYIGLPPGHPESILRRSRRRSASCGHPGDRHDLGRATPGVDRHRRREGRAAGESGGGTAGVDVPSVGDPIASAGNRGCRRGRCGTAHPGRLLPLDLRRQTRLAVHLTDAATKPAKATAVRGGVRPASGTARPLPRCRR